MRNLNISRRDLVKIMAAGPVASVGAAHAEPMEAVAGFPVAIGGVPFGAISHWLQPWRELCRTRSLDEIEAGIGVGIAGYDVGQDALDMLRRQGFRHARIEIPWGSVNPKTEDQFINQNGIVEYLARLRQADLRPLILLNANDGNPCPSTLFDVKIIADAPAGARSINLASTAGLVPGRSGFAHMQSSTLAPVLVTAIDGQQVSLSKPLPRAIAAGTTELFVTLHYEPFSQPGSPRNEQTLQGWFRYVDLVCRTATTALGTSDLADRGFDLEIWNELTFGSRFLAINNYYDPEMLDYDSRDIFGDLLRRTADHIAESPAAYHGVRLTDGFASTVPWSASSLEPPRVGAISKHPYPPILDFPKGDQLHLLKLDALGKKTDFIPTYKTYFPEYWANVIHTESLCRDVSPEPNPLGKTMHGRLARIIDGHVSPVDLWITEIGCAPIEVGVTDPAAAARMMAAFVLRCLFFHLGIGVGRVYLFQAFGLPGSLGLVDQRTPDTPSTVLLQVSRVLAAIRGTAESAPPISPTPVSWTAFRGPADIVLFEGDGTPDLPPMTTADSLVLLPIQASANRIAIIYYVMTRDIRVPLEAENIRVSIRAAGIQNFAVSSYDPISDRHSAPTRRAGLENQMLLEISATDIPQVLLLTL